MKQMTTRRLAALGLAAAMGLTLAACGEQQPSREEVEQAIEAGTLTVEDALDKGWIDQAWVDAYQDVHRGYFHLSHHLYRRQRGKHCGCGHCRQCKKADGHRGGAAGADPGGAWILTQSRRLGQRVLRPARRLGRSASPHAGTAEEGQRGHTTSPALFCRCTPQLSVGFYSAECPAVSFNPRKQLRISIPSYEPCCSERYQSTTIRSGASGEIRTLVGLLPN